jgi:hypothetical protein
MSVSSVKLDDFPLTSLGETDYFKESQPSGPKHRFCYRRLNQAKITPHSMSELLDTPQLTLSHGEINPQILLLTNRTCSCDPGGYLNVAV